MSTITMTSRTSRRLLLLLALALIVAACGGDGGDETAGGADPADSEAPSASGSESSGGSGTLLADQFDLSDVDVHVGTKDFTEMYIMGQISRIALEEAGASVEYTEDLVSPAGTREALMAGEIDTYWEYSGTAWFNFLNQEEAISDPQEQYDAVAEMDMEENNVHWGPAAPFNDQYGLSIQAANELAGEIDTLSDLATFVQENPEQASLCVDSNFANRDDGLPSIEEAYGFTWPDDQLIVSELAVIYSNVGAGEPCTFGMVFTTDGRIQAQDLKVFEDDQGALVSYLMGPTYQNSYYEENQVLDEVFGMIAEPLTEERIIELNRRVAVDGEFPEDVARDYLVEEGFIEG